MATNKKDSFYYAYTEQMVGFNFTASDYNQLLTHRKNKAAYDLATPAKTEKKEAK